MPSDIVRCVNCRIRIRREKHWLSEESDQIVETVKRWIYPRNLIGDDCLCLECLHLVYQDADDPQAPPKKGHLSACFECGISLGEHCKRRSKAVVRPEMSKQDVKILELILKSMIPEEITPDDKICLNCWRRTERKVTRIDIQRKLLKREDGARRYFNQENGVHEVSNTTNYMENAEITLPTLRRAPCTGSRCIYYKCQGKERRRIPNILRRKILCECNFYVPLTSRICQTHLSSNSYHELYDGGTYMSTFTAAHIEDLVSLLKAEPELDFGNPDTIDSRLFKHWFGKTKEEYREMLAQVPRLDNETMRIGFNALLIKMRTGESNTRIAELFEMSRRRLEVYMKEASDILVQDAPDAS